MGKTVYTAVTFAPVQGFIEKSRKLRDLYGSSLLLSLMAEVICRSAEAKPDCECKLISPALINNAKGTPNQILVKGKFPEAETIFKQTWKTIVDTCRQTIEQDLLPEEEYHWKGSWNRWANYAWEYFQEEVEVDTTDENDNNGINLVRQKLSERKRERDWLGINWQGESSSVSGIDGVAFPGMDGYQAYCIDASEFCTKLAQTLPPSIIDRGTDSNPNGEQLSIPELIKRLILLDETDCSTSEKKLNLNRRINEEINRVVFPQRQEQENPVLRVKIQRPPSFQELNRKDNNEWTGWFIGDGDEMGKYLQGFGNEEDKLKAFSECLINWGKNLETELQTLKDNQGLAQQVNHRIVYAGGDDFFGILSPGSQFSQPDNHEAFKPQHCLPLLLAFHQTLWVEKLSDQLQQTFGKPLTSSVGFVWAAPGVPQRDVIQHCRETESAAKSHGRDRLAIRILFNSGNYLDWHCPWWFLSPLTTAYRDRNGGQNWTHFYNDVAMLEARRAFTDDSDKVALALLDIYFGDDMVQILENNRQGIDPRTKILPKTDCKTLNQWVINLAKVGFQLYD